MKKKVFVALSGGVDSAVTAALLVRTGYDVTGVFLREYDLGLAFPFADEVICTQTGDRESALSVAAHLGIRFEEWDFRKEYKREVVDYLVREYKEGHTPNPDIMCNKMIKFGFFITQAMKRGADIIATGHYALKAQRARGRGYRLLQARDSNKDQTYFLHTLSQDQLAHTLFPIGDYTKQEVRKFAKKYGLPNWNRRDSQGVCFIGKLPMKEFLKSKVKPKTGPLLTLEGKNIGVHEGAWYYTIGQRHGIGFAGGETPYYVVGKDIEKNIVYVAQGDDNKALFRREARCNDIHWIAGTLPHFPFTCKARVRYRQPLQSCVLRREKGGYRITFSRPQRAVTPGQSIVFYKGRECLGGGIILAENHAVIQSAKN